jgi:hypothetical protein
MLIYQKVDYLLNAGPGRAHPNNTNEWLARWVDTVSQVPALERVARRGVGARDPRELPGGPLPGGLGLVCVAVRRDHTPHEARIFQHADTLPDTAGPLGTVSRWCAFY